LQIYEVFFNDRIVFTGSTFKKSLTDNDLLCNPKSLNEVADYWKLFLNSEKKGDLIYLTEDVDKVFDFFCSLFKTVVAAGGLVVNEKNELLCIYRFNKWDLPKGKVEKGEKIEDAAIREVEEECGIHEIRIKNKCSITYHIYENPRRQNEWIIKPTHWFIMEYSGCEKLKPQIGEAIIKAEWINNKNIDKVLTNTWESLKTLIISFANSELP